MKILIISEYFAPTLSIASIRWSKLSKYLVSKYGHNIDLLTNKKDYSGKSLFAQRANFDTSLVDDLGYIENVYELNSIRLSLVSFLRNAGNRGKKAIAGKLVNVKRLKQAKRESPVDSKTDNKRRGPNFKTGLSRSLFLSYESAVCKARMPKGFNAKNYDLVISSFGPKWPHIVARRIKQENPDCLWLADYRDIIVGGSTYLDTEENRSFAADITGCADCITGVFMTDDDWWQLGLPEGQRRETIPNGFDESPVVRKCRSDKFIISYTGTLYWHQNAKQDFTPLFRCLGDLKKQGRINLDDVCVVYAGSTGHLFDEMADSYPEVPSQNLGYVSREQAIMLQRESALLALLTWNTSTVGGAITGKVFEYLSSKVPIVAICSGDLSNSITRQMLEAANSGYCYEEANENECRTGLEDYISKMYQQWRDTGSTSINCNDRYIHSCSYEARADKLEEVLQSIMKDGMF